MSASSLANGVLNTPLQVWEFLRDEGGIDAKRYDESLVEDLRAALNEALALLVGGASVQVAERFQTSHFDMQISRGSEPYGLERRPSLAELSLPSLAAPATIDVMHSTV